MLYYNYLVIGIRFSRVAGERKNERWSLTEMRRKFLVQLAQPCAEALARDT